MTYRVNEHVPTDIIKAIIIPYFYKKHYNFVEAIQLRSVTWSF